jgi:pantoate--beta-alanine ligase
MKVLRSPSVAARFCRTAKNLPRPLVLVPTMGALHAGHLSLIQRARKAAGPRGSVAVSIFVNPTQFGPNEDFSRYPRPIARDMALCREHGVNVLFMSDPAEMYPADHSVYVEETALSQTLCGKSRPGHFRGVCTVVCKLFNILAPDAAVFGEKDFQQLAIIRRMVRDLNLPVRIIAAPIVREPDGLALSSRNQYLSAEERAQAPVMRRALVDAASTMRASKRERDPDFLKRKVVEMISSAPLARIDYVETVDAETLEPATNAARKLLIACAVFFGKTRLIDNIAISKGATDEHG